MSSWQLKTKIILCISLFLLNNCSFNNDKSSPKDSIRVGVSTYPQSFDPRRSSDSLSHKINQLIYRGLFKFDHQLNLIPDLIENYKWIDNKTLDIKLQSDIFFHDGSPLTAHDVKATFESILDPKLNSIYRQSFSKISQIEIISNSHLIIHLHETFSPFLTSLNMGILPKKIVDSDFKPIGAGIFKLEKWVENESISLERVSPHKQLVNKIIFRSIFDDTLRTLELIKGRLDLVQNSIPPVLIPAIKNADLNIKYTPGINFNYLGFNTNHSLLSLKKLRQAITLSIDRDEIIKYKLKGLGEKATSLLTPIHWAYNKNIQLHEYNPKLAENLLDEAGFTKSKNNEKEPRLTLVYKTSTKKDKIEIALLIKEQLKKVGIQLEIKSYEWGTFFRDIRTGQFEIYSLTWVGITEPDIYYYAFHSSMIPPNGANRGFYINHDLDTLLEKGRKTLNQFERIKVYQKIQKIIFDDFVYVPLWYDQNYVITQPDIKGYQLRPDAGYQGLVNIYRSSKSNDQLN